MIDGQADPGEIGLRRREEQAPGGNVHADHKGGLVSLRGPVGGGVDGVHRRDVGVGEDIGLLAPQPQGGAQAGGAADGVSVGPAVGQDQNVVLPLQQLSGLSGRQHLSPRPPE